MSENNRIVEMNVKVIRETKETIEKLSEQTGMTTGEVVDRLLLTCSPTDAETAFLFMMDNFMINMKNLNSVQFNEVILKFLKTLDSGCKDNEPDEMREVLDRLMEKIEKKKNEALGVLNDK